MSKTAVQIAIEKVEDSINTFKMFEDINEHAPSVIRILQIVLEGLKSLLPTERQQIEQAAYVCAKEVLGMDTPDLKTIASDYFTKNYENEQDSNTNSH